jgi:hypothetical protein
VDGPEATLLRSKALDRLRRSDNPWAVVLDNANGDPDKIGALPTPVADRGQLLIVTTTNDAWKDRIPHVIDLDPLVIDLDPLPGAEVEGELEAGAPLEALAGRPLLVDASQRFHRATGRWWWTTHIPEPGRKDDQAPGLFWAAVNDALARDGLARTVACTISWLPPVRIDRGAVIKAAGGGTAEAIASLERLGLIDAEADGITMHRLFRQAVREAETERDRPEQTILVYRLLTEPASRRVMEFAADMDTAGAMGELLAASADDAVAVTGLHALGQLFERHETARKSAEWYELALQRVGWRRGQAPPDDHRLEVVDCLRGIARAVMRKTGTSDSEQRAAELDRAIGWVEQAEDLCRGHEDAASRLAASQAWPAAEKASRGRKEGQCRRTADPARGRARLAAQRRRAKKASPGCGGQPGSGPQPVQPGGSGDQAGSSRRAGQRRGPSRRGRAALHGDPAHPAEALPVRRTGGSGLLYQRAGSGCVLPGRSAAGVVDAEMLAAAHRQRAGPGGNRYPAATGQRV